jgi:uncharacterized membrane protein YccC
MAPASDDSPPGRPKGRTRFALLSDLVGIERSKIAIAVGLRCSLGVVVPLVVGVASGHSSSGVAAAVGTLVVGFVSFEGRHRATLRAMLFASAAVALSTLVGSLAGSHLLVLLVVLACWGAAAGLVGSLGPGASAAALQAVVVLVVFSSLPMGLVPAATQAGWVLAGSLFQTLLFVATWPRGSLARAERIALADLYRRLARYARAAPPRAPAADQLRAAAEALGDPNPVAAASTLLVLEELLALGEEIRLSLSALVYDRHRTAAAEGPGSAHVGALDAALAAAAGWIEAIADTIRAKDQKAAGAQVSSSGPRRQFADLAPRLLDQLEVATHLAARIEEPSQKARRTLQQERARPRRHGSLARVRVLLKGGLEDRAARALALRLAAVLVLGSLLARLLHLHDGYWVPMTAAIVVRGDLAGTLQRGIGRLLGTLAGSGLVTAIAALTTPSRSVLVIAVLVLMWGTYATYRANYVLYAVFLTSSVVALLALVGAPIILSARDRAVATAIGGVLALLAFLAWPTWKRRLLPAALSAAVESQGAYAAAIAFACAEAGADLSRLFPLARAARASRASLAELITAVATEPGGSNDLIAAARAIERQLARCAHLALALHAQLLAGEVKPLGAAAANCARLLAKMSSSQAIAVRQARAATGSQPTSAPGLICREETTLAELADAYVELGSLIEGFLATATPQSATLVE